MKRFEYHIEHVYSIYDDKAIESLNEYGEQGWEIIGIDFIEGSGDLDATVFFKREKDENEN